MLNPLLSFVLSLLGPGLGHAYCRDWRRALCYGILCLAAIYAANEYAAADPLLLLAFTGFALIVNLTVAYTAWRKAARTSAPPGWLLVALYIFIGGTTYKWVIRPGARVGFYAIHSMTMSPTLLPGDHFAVDRKYTQFKEGDLVAAEMEDHALHIRRVTKFENDSVLLASDSPDHSMSEVVPRAALKGKVLYVMYALEDGTLKPVWNRCLLWVK